MTDLDRKLLYGSTELLVLTLLARRPNYGYQIRRELRERSRHAIHFAFGRVYPMLHLMERRSWVRKWKQGSPKGPPRWLYAITPAGRAELKLRRQKWDAYASAMSRVLG